MSPSWSEDALRSLPQALADGGDWTALADLLSNPSFLEAKARAGLVGDLVGDLALAERLPAGHPSRPLLLRLAEAVAMDAAFLRRHPEALFQQMWNRCWWSDAPEAARHYEDPAEPDPGQAGGPTLHRMLEAWRADKGAREPGFCWVRSLRPPREHLDSGVRAVFQGWSRYAIAPDGRWLASVVPDNDRWGHHNCKLVRLWDTLTGQPLRDLTGHSSPIEGLCVTPDGRKVLASAREIRVWDARTGERLARYGARSQSISSLACSPDGRLVASQAADKHYRTTIQIREVDSGRLVRKIRGPYNGDVAFSPDGRYLRVTGISIGLRVWDVATGSEVFVSQGSSRYKGLHVVACSPDGLLYAFGMWDHSILLLDARSFEVVRTLAGHEDAVSALAWSPDGLRLASGGNDATVRVWEVATGREIHALRGHRSRDPDAPQGSFEWGKAAIANISWSADGRRLASGGGDGLVKVWDARDGVESRTLRGRDWRLSRVDFLPDGRRLLGRGDPTSIILWDLDRPYRQRTLRSSARGCDEISWTRVSPDRRSIAFRMPDHTVRVLSTETGVETLRLGGEAAGIRQVTWLPPGSRLATASGDGTVRVWGPGVDRPLLTLRGHDGRICEIAATPDGGLLATGGEDRTVRVWDGATGAPRHRLEGHEGEVHNVSFLKGGRLASCSYGGDSGGDGTRRLWDVERGRELRRLGPLADEVSDDLLESPDGRWIVHVQRSDPPILVVLDAATGEDHCVLTGPEGGLQYCVFLPDHRRLAGFGHDDTIHIWDLIEGRSLMSLCVRRPDPAEDRDLSFRLDRSTGHLVSFLGEPETEERLTASEWDLATGRCVREITDEAEIRALRGPAGARWRCRESPSFTRHVEIREVGTERPLAWYPEGVTISVIMIRRERGLFALTTSGGGHLHLLKLEGRVVGG